MRSSHADVVDAATIPGHAGLRFVGPFNNRITFYSQQVRSLRLAHAINALKLIGASERVAVVGAGAAGATMAVALALLGHDVTLYDPAQEILQLQSASSRLLHPHIYEWPALGSLEDRAGLPVMDWTAGSAGDVCKSLRAEFDRTLAALRGLTFEWGCRLSALDRVADAWRLSFDGRHGSIGRIFPHVILAIGFGDERTCGIVKPEDYWRPGAIGTSATEPRVGTTYLVSGNGDGALTELLALLVADFEHVAFTRRFLGLFSGDELRTAAQVACEGMVHGDDIGAGLGTSLVPVLDLYGGLDRLRPSLRKDRAVTINSSGPLFSIGKASLLNQCMVFSILEAARLEGLAVRRTSGHLTDVSGATGAMIAAGIGATVGPFDYIKPRHGPDIATRYGPVGPLLATYKAHIAPLLKAKPELATPPALANETYEFFENLRIEKTADHASKPSQRRQAIEDRNRIEVCFDGATRVIIERGDRTLKEVAVECERLPARVTIDLHVAPAKFPAASDVVRLARGSDGRIEVRTGEFEPEAWRALLPGMADAPPPSSVRTPRALNVADLDALVDLRLLRALDMRIQDAVIRGVAPPLGSISCEILDKISAVWENWRTALEVAKNLRSDVLRWLANVDQARPLPWDGDAASIQRMANALIMTMAVHGVEAMSPTSLDRGNFLLADGAVALGTGCEAIGSHPISVRTDPQEWGVDALVLSAVGDVEVENPLGRVLDGGTIGNALMTARRVSPAIVQNNRHWRARLGGDLAGWTSAVLEEFAKLRHRQDAELRGVSG